MAKPESSVREAESVLTELAAVFFRHGSLSSLGHPGPKADGVGTERGDAKPNLDATYRILVEQIPAVVFMAYLDGAAGEAYVSPRIENTLGYSQAEWLEDPIRWYDRIHPDDKGRWSVEAAELLVSGKPLRSAYRVLARDGRVVWFQCEAKMVRRDHGQPWFIHGVGFDITDLKATEAALQSERNLASTVLDTVNALVIVLDEGGRIIRFNRSCEKTSGYDFAEVTGKSFWNFFEPDQAHEFQQLIDGLQPGEGHVSFESDWITRSKQPRRISWSTTALRVAHAPSRWVVTGTDITERQRMEEALLDVSGREQRQIARDLHDGLGQHLTGIAFMSKVLAKRLGGSEDDPDAAKIVQLVNEAIHKTRELARGLLPVVSKDDGLATALTQWATEVEDLFGISCVFECAEPVLVADVAVATHVYHIAHEAVNNAIRHGEAKRIVLSLSRNGSMATLQVRDSGKGFSPNHIESTGLGLRIMNHRASMIGGSLEVEASETGGALVTCRFPVPPKGNDNDADDYA